MKTKQTKPDLRVPTLEELVSNAYNPACTTVWTNHGEPQEIDQKYSAAWVESSDRCTLYGVALQTEVETEATRQASPIPEIDESVQKYVNKMRAKYAKVWEERSDSRAQRDELLAAAKEAVEILRDYDNEEEARELLQTAIANASK